MLGSHEGKGNSMDKNSSFIVELLHQQSSGIGYIILYNVESNLIHLQSNQSKFHVDKFINEKNILFSMMSSYSSCVSILFFFNYPSFRLSYVYDNQLIE